MSLVTHKYTPSEMSDQELEATFAAREHTIDYLLKALRDQARSGTLSSFVITGPRGAGKSTVIHMTVFRLKQDPKLMAAWIPIVFPEEQFNLASLRDLLAATLQQLAAQGHGLAQAWLQKVEAEPNDEQSQQLAITGLREVTRKAHKRLILFVENLNLLFDESLNDQMKGTLRRLLMADPFMMLIGSAVRVFDSLKSYDEAFFNYFGEVPLDRLTAEQVFELLTRRARFDQNERFLREFPKQQPKVRAIVHLSGGNPRLILMLYELLSQRQVTTIVQYLRRLVDELTPLLKDEMERLPPQQRKIIHALMEKGGTAQPTDLVGPTRLPLNAITTQLRRLKEAQILDVLGGGKGKAANYTVPDKLFAIWYQMRYLSQNRRRIELFVEVLRIWFEEEERLQTLQNLNDNVQATAPSALRETATTAEYFAASLKGTQRERLAADLCVRQWVKADLREAAQVYTEFFSADYGRVIPDEVEQQANLGDWLASQGDYPHAVQAMNEIISKYPKNPERLAWALYNRGVAKGNTGDTHGEIADYTAVVEMQNAPIEQRASALVNRGASTGVLGDTQGAITDFTAVVEMEDAPKEQRAKALVNRGLAKGRLGDIPGAVADFTAVVEMQDVPREHWAKALLNRGVGKAMLGDTHGEIADYTAVVEMQNAPIEQRASALVNRGASTGVLGDTQGAITDFTAVVEMEDAPKEQRAKALVNRGLAKGRLGDIPGAVADFTAVVEMQDVPREHWAKALLNRGVGKAMLGDTHGEIADYTAVVEMEDAPEGVQAKALLNRGVGKGKLGDTQGEIADYSAVVEMEDAPKYLRANALFNRGVSKRKLDDAQGAISDYTAVLEIEGAPKELHAKALFNRGMHRGRLGDTLGEIADYTAVLDMKDVPKEERARAMFNRALSKGKLGDTQGEISDYTTLIGMEGAPKDLRAKATFNRGASKLMLGTTEAAIPDFVAVVDLAATEDDLLARAAQLAFELSWANKQRPEADETLSRFAAAVNSLPPDKAREATVHFLNILASPGLADAWVHGYGILARALRPEVTEALEFLEPVCAVLEGKDRSVLNSLPPEERDFAETVLKRFEAKPLGKPTDPQLEESRRIQR